MIEDFEPSEIVDTPVEKILSHEEFRSASFDEITKTIENEKGSPLIEKELKAYESFDSGKKKNIDDKINNKANFSFDELGKKDAFEELNDEPSDSKDTKTKDDKTTEGNNSTPQTQPQGSVEDYFSSAEFVIFVVELAIVWGTNFYLKSNLLDTIAIEEFKKTSREQKMLVRSWAKILHKYSFKIGVEMELLFALGSAYGTKIKGIVKRQEDRKFAEGKLKRKTPPNNNQSAPVDTPPEAPKKQETVRQRTAREVKEKLEKENPKKEDKAGFDFTLDTSGITEE